MKFFQTNRTWVLSLLPLLSSILSYQKTHAVEADLLLSPTDPEHTQFQFDLQTSEKARHTWDLQTSSDLENWVRLTNLVSEQGIGQLVLDPQSGLFGGIFYRAQLDESTDTLLNLPNQPYNYSNITLPPHFTNNNPVTDAGATLGRVLFYDPKFSRNYTISCASCHLQENAFSDPEKFSAGFEGGLTGRNSMGLTNAKFYDPGHFFWDERADTLEDQTLLPIQDSVEMGMDLESLVQRLQEYEYYEQLFLETFGDSTVTTERISLALSQFIRSMLSYQSKYDVGEQSNFTNFTQEENLGRQLFNSNRANCNNCHEGTNFVGDEPENNGLEFPFLDLGVGGVNGNPNDEGKFKMPSLRNIEMTAPYMHDGRFETLEEVIDHYSTGIVANPNLGNQLEDNNRPVRPNFNIQEKAALVAFLKTLTDQNFLTDPKFSDPFRTDQ